MEKIKKFLFFSLVAVMAFGFAGCDNDDSSDDAGVNEGKGGTVKVIEKTENGGTLLVSAVKDSSSGSTELYYTYLSLSSGEKVDATSAASTSWDLRFAASRRILTNSGKTAESLGSNGLGGVVVFNGENSVDDLDYDVPMATDVSPWIKGMGPAARPTLTNLLSFPGYPLGDGKTKETAYHTTETSACPYDQDQYFNNPGMPPKYTVKDKVYVVRHADGTSYSKFQVLALEYSKSKDKKVTTYFLRIKYENLAN